MIVTRDDEVLSSAPCPSATRDLAGLMSCTHEEADTICSCIRHVERNKQVPRNWQEFLRVDENKSELFHLISDRMKNFQDS